MILGIQIVALIFVVAMVYLTYIHYKKNEINGIEALILLCIWSSVVLIVLFPELFRTFSRSIAVTRAFDLAMMGGFILLFPLVYLCYVRLNRLQKKFEKYITEDAIKNAKKKRRRSS